MNNKLRDRAAEELGKALNINPEQAMEKLISMDQVAKEPVSVAEINWLTEENKKLKKEVVFFVKQAIESEKENEKLRDKVRKLTESCNTFMESALRQQDKIAELEHNIKEQVV